MLTAPHSTFLAHFECLQVACSNYTFALITILAVFKHCMGQDGDIKGWPQAPPLKVGQDWGW